MEWQRCTKKSVRSLHHFVTEVCCRDDHTPIRGNPDGFVYQRSGRSNETNCCVPIARSVVKDHLQHLLLMPFISQNWFYIEAILTFNLYFAYFPVLNNTRISRHTKSYSPIQCNRLLILTTLKSLTFCLAVFRHFCTHKLLTATAVCN